MPDEWEIESCVPVNDKKRSQCDPGHDSQYYPAMFKTVFSDGVPSETALTSVHHSYSVLSEGKSNPR